MLAVDHRRVDLHTPVDRAGVHDDGVGLGQLQLLGRQAKALKVFLARRQQRAAHALVLQAQHDDHVTALNAFGQVIEDAHPHLRHVGRHQGFGADHPHFGAAQSGQGVDVRARHARVQHVADDGHGEVGEIFFVVPDSEHVQQALGGMGVTPVTGVDHVHMGRDVLGNQIRRAGLAVAHHKNIGRHGRQIGNGVEQRLALAGRGAGNVQGVDIGRQAGGRDVKGGAGAGAVFKKQVEHAFAAQQWYFFHFAVVHAGEVGCGVQDMGEDLFGQAFGGQEVNQFTVFVELGVVAFVEHGVLACVRLCPPLQR